MSSEARKCAIIVLVLLPICFPGPWVEAWRSKRAKRKSIEVGSSIFQSNFVKIIISIRFSSRNENDKFAFLIKNFPNFFGISSSSNFTESDKHAAAFIDSICVYYSNAMTHRLWLILVESENGDNLKSFPRTATCDFLTFIENRARSNRA